MAFLVRWTLHICLLQAQQVAVCTEDCVAPQLYPALQAALTATQSHSQITLSPDSDCYALVAYNVIQHSFWIQGNSRSILFNAVLQVDVLGELKITSTILLMRENEFPCLLKVYGKVWMDDCEVVGLRVPFSEVLGLVRLQHVRFQDNLGTAISLSRVETTLSLEYVQVTNHTGNFLHVTEQPLSLSLHNSTFRDGSDDDSTALIHLTYTGLHLTPFPGLTSSTTGFDYLNLL